MQHSRATTAAFQNVQARTRFVGLQFDTQGGRRRFRARGKRPKCNRPAAAFFSSQLQTSTGLVSAPRFFLTSIPPCRAV